MSAQILVLPNGRLVRASDPRPGSMHDVAAPGASGLFDGIDPSGWIADKGYIGRGMITQGLGKVGLSGWAGDQVDGSSGAWGHGPGGGGDGGRGAVGQADEADGEVSQGGHDLWCVAGAQPVAVLVEDHVSDPVEAVLYGPVPSGPGGDLLGRGLVHGKGADQVDHLDALPPPDGSGASDPDHLGGAGQVDPGGRLDGLDGAPHPAPVGAVGDGDGGHVLPGRPLQLPLQAGLVVLDGEHVVGAAGDDPLGRAPLGAPWRLRR